MMKMQPKRQAGWRNPSCLFPLYHIQSFTDCFDRRTDVGVRLFPLLWHFLE